MFLFKNVFKAMTFFGCIALKCVPMNNQECKIRPEIIHINSNGPLFYLYSIKYVNAVVVAIIFMSICKVMCSCC